MYDRDLDCLSDQPEEARPVHAVRPDALQAWLSRLPEAQSQFLRQSGFTASAGSVALMPGPAGVAGAVLGLGAATGPQVFGALASALPPGTLWRLGEGIEDAAEAVLGFCLGAYRFAQLKSAAAPPGARLLRPSIEGIDAAISAARATWLVRDLVNLPANLLGPAELAEAAASVLGRIGAHVNVITGAALARVYPAIEAVGRGSARPAYVVHAQWRGSRTIDDCCAVSICGKGVCFDTGGYDLKPAGAMLRMKKDMAGAAIAIGLARMIIDADLPVSLELRIGCVENAVCGNAMRPLDVLKTRSGLMVEVGNTDAEGRLVLCDLLTEACEAKPDLLFDFATLTGAARVALGPDLPAMFCNDDALAQRLTESGTRTHDPVWRLPLHAGYTSWLDSSAGDLNNVSDKPHAGAIIAALFLQRFVSAQTAWAHFDVYGWNESSRPGCIAGGDAQTMRAVFETISSLVHVAV